MLLSNHQMNQKVRTLPTFCAVLLSELAMCGAACKPFETFPNWSSIAMAASPYAGASNGTTFRAVDTYGIALSACLSKSPVYGIVFVPIMQDLYGLTLGTAFHSDGTFKMLSYQSLALPKCVLAM